VVVGEESAIDLQRLLEEGLGGGVLPLRLQIECQVVVAGGGVGMVIGEEPAADLQRLLEEGLGGGILRRHERSSLNYVPAAYWTQGCWK
jgi:hypothetical protein